MTVESVDVDRLLRRRLMLQRYIAQLQREVIEAQQHGERAILAVLREFVETASDREMAALASLRIRNRAARDLLAELRRVMGEQATAARAVVTGAVVELVEREGRATAAALTPTPESVSMRGVASQPIGGETVAVIMAAAMLRYSRRLLSDVVIGAAEDPGAIVARIRGTRAEKWRNGLFRWRDDRVIRPAVDVVVGGAAGNAATVVYRAAGIEREEWLATLDYRTCPSCRAAEEGGPYPIGRGPVPPMHPRCRCLRVPDVGSTDPLRPYVRDFRSVKDIPKAERGAGEIGQTRMGIEEFFGRMSAADLKAYLGPSRYELWRAGKVKSVRDLVNAANLQPLRLDQLPE